MNYLKIYEKLIDRAVYKKLDMQNMEWHHILPVCLGGTDNPNNIVALTPEEHFIAHRLLTKIFPDELGIQLAFFKMSFGDYLEDGITNKMYRRMKCYVNEYNFEQLNKNKDTQEYCRAEFKRFKELNGATTREKRQYDSIYKNNYLTKEIVEQFVIDTKKENYDTKFSKKREFNERRIMIKLNKLLIQKYRESESIPK